jgi:hypothetical protein
MNRRRPRLLASSLPILIAFGAIAFVTSRLGTPPNVSAQKADSSEPGTYRVLPPIESRDLTIFPVVRVTGSQKDSGWQYLTLDEGLKSGEVVVTEAGQVQGLVRNRRPGGWRLPGDQVNQLVLVNNSSKPLLLLAGEIVTGGKQDRVIAKDRIVPPQADPIDLSVFCIEPGRWVQTSDQFSAAGKANFGFMVQPAVRRQAMVAQDQQKVWGAVGAAIGGMAGAASPSAQSGEGAPPVTTSYAKTMQDEAVEHKVDEAGQTLLQSREQILAKLRQEHAVGVVAAVHGEIIWADIFADPGLLEKYWTKLIRSYAAEALTSRSLQDTHATQKDAQLFVDKASYGHETSDGEVGVYRYSEMHAGDVTSFALRVLLPGTDFDVHISRVRMESGPIIHALQ